MEILLDSGIVTKVGGGFILILFLSIIVGMLGFLSVSDGLWKTGAACFLVVVLCIAVMIFVPACSLIVPTDVHRYVVEITDENKYKELIDNGYSLDKLYENRNIYKITGDVLE